MSKRVQIKTEAGFEKPTITQNTAPVASQDGGFHVHSTNSPAGEPIEPINLTKTGVKGTLVAAPGIQVTFDNPKKRRP